MLAALSVYWKQVTELIDVIDLSKPRQRLTIKAEE